MSQFSIICRTRLVRIAATRSSSTRSSSTLASRSYSSLLKSVATRFIVRPDRPITTIRRPCPVGRIYPAPETSGGTADDRPALFLRRASGVATRVRADVRIARLNRLAARVAGRPDSRLGSHERPGHCRREGLRHPDGHDARVRLLPRPEGPDRVTQGVREVVSLARDVVERDRPSIRRLELEHPELDRELRVRSGSPVRIRKRRKGRGRSSRPRMMGTDGGETERFESYVPIPEVRSLHIRPRFMKRETDSCSR